MHLNLLKIGTAQGRGGHCTPYSRPTVKTMFATFLRQASSRPYAKSAAALLGLPARRWKTHARARGRGVRLDECSCFTTKGLSAAFGNLFAPDQDTDADRDGIALIFLVVVICVALVRPFVFVSYKDLKTSNRQGDATYKIINEILGEG